MKHSGKNQLTISYIIVLLLITMPLLATTAWSGPNENKFESSASKQDNLNIENFPVYKTTHNNSGCPENSYCKKNLGKKRSRWVNFVTTLRGSSKFVTRKIEAFRAKHGIPIDVWYIEKENREKIIHWNSICQSHSTKNNKVYVAEIISKNLKKIKTPGIHFEKCLLIHNKKILKFPIPRGQIPLYIDGNRPVFISNIGNHYFGLRVSSKGALNVVPIKFPIKPPVTVDCPEKIKNKLNLSIDGKKVFLHPHCKKIYNGKNKKFEIAMFMRACI
ncbi:MAG: hypothetical protein KAQ98_06190 [Bacteriovoracaceae bacterium]|nr:hypothetical protein [Bacteriovoracaceae bacterium]